MIEVSLISFLTGLAMGLYVSSWLIKWIDKKTKK
jgi:hypothetical protein